MYQFVDENETHNFKRCIGMIKKWVQYDFRLIPA